MGTRSSTYRRPLLLHGATTSRVSTAQDGTQAAKRPAQDRQVSQSQLQQPAAAKPSTEVSFCTNMRSDTQDTVPNLVMVPQQECR